ncbi:hypothetical protein LWI29_032512 [Acer saccharum]|uniref:Phytosulfokine n=1 Tax=Acer saccharum TaxID=4024 RepID=A0AA39TEZ1_ACESA|nr:hypothetical protein LWI29_032512 [Acer saccharum]KAK1588355.1 hypothetical protein Q3G72_022434 [Acer saccharum]
MKQNLHLTLLFFILVIISSSKVSSARFIVTKQQGQEEVKLMREIPSSQDSLQVMEDIESIKELMGMETCDNGDEECFKRRIISEAHLDYIYTQHHKP